MLLVQRERVLLAQRADTPSLVPMGRDERVLHDDYAGQDPGAVARQVREAAAMLAHTLGHLGPEGRARTVRYNYPAPAVRDVAWVADHTLHELVHHRGDIEAQAAGGQ